MVCVVLFRSLASYGEFPELLVKTKNGSKEWTYREYIELRKYSMVRKNPDIKITYRNLNQKHSQEMLCEESSVGTVK